MIKLPSAATLIFSLATLSAAIAPGQPLLDQTTRQIEDQIKNGTEPGYLGLVADDKLDGGRGTRVIEIVTDGPAATSGLQKDDLITAINGRAVKSNDDIGVSLSPLVAGAKVTFDIERGGRAQQLQVTLGRRPPPGQRRFENFGRIPEPAADPSRPSLPSAAPEATTARPILGVRTLPITPETQQRLRLPTAAGAHVVARTAGSPAATANVPLDAVITAVDGTAIQSPTELAAAVARAGAGKNIELTYTHNGATVRTQVTLGSDSPAMNSGGMAMDSARPPRAADVPRLPGPAVELPPPTFQPGVARPMTDAQRIETLERRVRELEERLLQMEDALRSRSRT